MSGHCTICCGQCESDYNGNRSHENETGYSKTEGCSVTEGVEDVGSILALSSDDDLAFGHWFVGFRPSQLADGDGCWDGHDGRGDQVDGVPW